MNNSADDRSAAMAAHGRSSQFASNWLVGCGPVTRATRRRLLAVLRLAHSVLGMDRKRLGLGGLGAGGVAALLASIGVLAAGSASAQYAAGGGTATGPSVAIGSGAGSGTIANGASGAVAIGGGATANSVGGINNASIASGPTRRRK